MSWINDRINFCKGESHNAVKAPSLAVHYPNATHHADLEKEKTALAEMNAVACKKLIEELWLSECETSISEEKRAYRSSKELGEKLTITTRHPARRSWTSAA